MKAFIKTKLKKSDDQTNIEKYRVAANIITIISYQNYSFLETLFPIHDYKANISCKKMYIKMSKINIFKMDIWTFWSQLSSCYPFYIVHNCMKNHTEFKILILTYLN